jgi:hypothetical protein
MSYPIIDIPYHEQALRDLNGDLELPESAVTVRYHLTAICALQMGAAHDIDGPAYEFRRDGKVTIRQVESELRAEEGPHGITFVTQELKTDDQS